MTVFRSLSEALRAGWQVYDRFADGYLVRQRTAAGMVLAIVILRDDATLAEHMDSSQIVV
jgi:hypothetical protein